MRVLLDENIPRKLKHRLSPDHDVATVPERGWAGLLNGDLLRAADAEFDAFVTLDRGLAYQQDLTGRSLRLVVLRSVSNKYEDLLPLVPSIQAALNRLSPGAVAHIAG